MKEIQIDFVVTWLDSSDPEWQKSLAIYSHKSTGHKEKARFRSTDFFLYWFRAVERYAPWVHKVYLVTNGKFPDWINKDCPKLELVKHADFIPTEYLPTFNCRTIEMHLHNIKGLLEHFEIPKENIDYFLIHQANQMINKLIQKRLKVDDDHCPYNIAEFGNSSSTTIPLMIVNKLRNNFGGKKIVACGFGTGLAWGALCFDPEKTIVVSEMVHYKA